MTFKYSSVINILFVFCMIIQSCQYNETQKIKVDIDFPHDSIKYSMFSESIQYIELNTNDSCIISDIQKIYIDDDTIIVSDTKNAGVITFNKNGEMIKQIDFYGEGQNEFIEITAFCIDPVLNHVCIWDFNLQKIIRYDYNGRFVEANRSKFFIRDFTILESKYNLCFVPFYCKTTDYGVWISDIHDNVKKKFNINVPDNDKMEFSGTYYNSNNNKAYYYDWNYDHFYLITKDSLQLLYEFDFKQKLAPELREKQPETLMPLRDFAKVNNFSTSENHLLMSYYYYGKSNPYCWALLNRKNDELLISDKIYNDLDEIQTDYPNVFYINDTTWCRVVERDANNCNILLQILHLKN